VRVYDKNKNVLKTINSTDNLTTGTSDGVDDTNSHGFALSTSGGSQPGVAGVKTLITNSCFLKSVTKTASATPTKAYLIESAVYSETFATCYVIASATFSGNVATFSSPVYMAKGKRYLIACGSDGSNYTQYYNGSATLTSFNDCIIEPQDLFGFMNITSFVTQTASVDAIRETDDIDFVMVQGKYYYISVEENTIVFALF
jgi:hypothetical protein